MSKQERIEMLRDAITRAQYCVTLLCRTGEETSAMAMLDAVETLTKRRDEVILSDVKAPRTVRRVDIAEVKSGTAL